MKVIVTGSTGTVGSAVLSRCIEHPSVTSIVALTRRPLEVKSPKLNNIVHKDFLKYENDVVEQMKGAEACIWALGSPTSGKEVHIDYTMTAVNTFLTSIVPQLAQDKKFRFVYTSGGLVPYLDSNALFFLGPKRKLRGDLDRDLLRIESENAPRWESYVIRPWQVTDQAPTNKMTQWIFGENTWIYRKELGAAMLDAAMNGCDQRVLDNMTLRANGQEALKASL